MKAILLAITTIALLTSCTGRMTLMKNAAGDVKECKVSATSEMMTGAWSSGREVDRCVDQWKKVGYKEVK